MKTASVFNSSSGGRFAGLGVGVQIDRKQNEEQAKGKKQRFCPPLSECADFNGCNGGKESFEMCRSTKVKSEGTKKVK
jgi:hypothetical protein